MSNDYVNQELLGIQYATEDVLSTVDNITTREGNSTFSSKKKLDVHQLTMIWLST